LVHDPLCAADEAFREYGIELRPPEALTDLEGLILAVPHARFLEGGPARVTARLRPGGVLIDVKSTIAQDSIPPDVHHWSL
jgi:UDP-N-acetyl-D-galactosamine dehydrogenase